MENYSLITVLGWEDRFLKGLDIILNDYNVNNITLIIFKDYRSMENMESNLEKVDSIANDKGINLNHIELEYNNSINNWKILNTFFTKNKIENALLNLTTIPRETIWTLLFYLKKQSSIVNYIYFKPEKYSGGWLTKNHKEPRLLFKHSGIFELEKKLVLFVISGFDESRLNQLVEYYEPLKLIIFSDSGEDFRNQERNKELPKFYDVEIEVIKMNTYDIESSREILNEQIENNKEFNIIIASQGPKTSSISTYSSYLDSDSQVGLAYVPAREFNTKYSSGINENYIKGKIDLERK